MFLTFAESIEREQDGSVHALFSAVPAWAARPRCAAGAAQISEGKMSDPCNEEIQKTIRRAAESGDILIVAMSAKTIATLCGGSPRLIAEALTQAGIRAGITMQFGSPE